jgi:RNA polymerase sigma factor (sigma-70 family)
MSFLTAELLAQLLDAHAAALELFAAQWSQAPADVVQEAFIELAGQGKQPDNVVAWLYRVVRHRAYDQARAESRRRRRESAAAELSDRWLVTESRMAIGTHEARVALRELPIELREVLVARIWCGLTFEQIAEITETSTATAFRRHKQALAFLRTRLGIACPGEEKTKT